MLSLLPLQPREKAEPKTEPGTALQRPSCRVFALSSAASPRQLLMSRELFPGPGEQWCLNALVLFSCTPALEREAGDTGAQVVGQAGSQGS